MTVQQATEDAAQPDTTTDTTQSQSPEAQDADFDREVSDWVADGGRVLPD